MFGRNIRAALLQSVVVFLIEVPQLVSPFANPKALIMRTEPKKYEWFPREVYKYGPFLEFGDDTLDAYLKRKKMFYESWNNGVYGNEMEYYGCFRYVETKFIILTADLPQYSSLRPLTIEHCAVICAWIYAATFSVLLTHDSTWPICTCAYTMARGGPIGLPEDKVSDLYCDRACVSPSGDINVPSRCPSYGYYSIWSVCKVGKFLSPYVCTKHCNCLDQSEPCEAHVGLCPTDECLPYFKGPSCNQPIILSPCGSSPCMNGGTCTEGAIYECECELPYRGTRCEIPRRDPCESSPCLNGGACELKGDTWSYICLCMDLYVGHHCEEKLEIVIPTYVRKSVIAVPVGCYYDDPMKRDVGEVFLLNLTMTTQICVQYCEKNQFTYSAMQNGTDCRCGHVYGAYGVLDKSSCNKMCPGDSSEYCGGDTANSIYKTCPLNRYGNSCALSCNCMTGYCHMTTGICDGPCSRGYTGPLCLDKDASLKLFTISLTVFEALLSGIVFVSSVVSSLMSSPYEEESIISQDQSKNSDLRKDSDLGKEKKTDSTAKDGGAKVKEHSEKKSREKLKSSDDGKNGKVSSASKKPSSKNSSEQSKSKANSASGVKKEEHKIKKS